MEHGGVLHQWWHRQARTRRPQSTTAAVQSLGKRSSVSELCQDVDPKKGLLVMPTGYKSPSEVHLE